MARGARLDAPGVLHHVMVRGIERRPIFQDDRDRTDFVTRLADLGGIRLRGTTAGHGKSAESEIGTAVRRLSACSASATVSVRQPIAPETPQAGRDPAAPLPPWPRSAR